MVKSCIEKPTKASSANYTIAVSAEKYLLLVAVIFKPLILMNRYFLMV